MKKTNKGFSLVELIIVIAIMAILAGAIAPALIRYIDKSRRSNDVSSCKSIKTAVETALGTEDVYTWMTETASGDTADCAVMLEIVPNTKTAAGSTYAAINPIKMVSTTPDGVEMSKYQALKVIGQNIGEKTPKLKFKKAADGSHKPNGKFYVFISKNGTVYVGISSKASPAATDFSINTSTGKAELAEGYMICPDVDEKYQ